MTGFLPSQRGDVAHAMAATGERQVAAIGRDGPWMPAIDPERPDGEPPDDTQALTNSEAGFCQDD
jgi:hypothetical protein